MSIVVEDLSYTFPNSTTPVLDHVSFSIASGERCLLLGRNGAGKSTLLQVLAGRRMIGERTVQLLGRSAFHDVSLVNDVAFIGGRFPFDTDIEVQEILAKLPERSAAEGERRRELLSVLGVNVRWHMHRVSDGQRRRVQLLLSLLTPKRVMLFDEATSDLDVIARLDLLAFLQREKDATVVYATHVFDRLDTWATRILWIDQGSVRMHAPIGEALAGKTLLGRVEEWLRG